MISRLPSAELPSIRKEAKAENGGFFASSFWRNADATAKNLRSSAYDVLSAVLDDSTTGMNF